MDRLYVQPKVTVPEIILDTSENVFLIKGNSCFENTQEIYEPVLTWFNDYLNELIEKNEDKFSIEFYFAYINSGSLKYLYDILHMLMKYKKSGIKVEVIWSYDSDDEDMKEEGERLTTMKEFDLNFKFNSIDR